MRLKILFFPLALVFSVYIAIAFTWPEFENVRQSQKDILEKKKILKNIQEKKENINSLKKILSGKQDKINLVENYYYFKQQEERIINEINYLATNSSVNLIDLNITEGQKALPVVSQESLTIQPKNVFSFGEEKKDEQQKEIIPTQYMRVKISSIGKYEDIKMFIDKIYKIGLFNKIDVIFIEKARENSSEKKDTVENNNLFASIEAEFGYLPRIVENDLNSPIFSQKDFDFYIVGKLENFIQKTSLIEAFPEVITNPFFLK